ncbi:NlpC/P60 family protein [Ligilactobacillus sp. LYQ60]|uniref:C40 family peptidase n=1 Tax=unclassified Ligilactobacillus TaxID=2767920 RepID=UPI0038539185
MKKTTKTLLAGTVGVAGAMLVTTATANADTVHKVVTNDTVSGLAQKYGVSIQSIEQLNNINKQTGMIYQGQDLQIPTKNDTDNVQNYTVQAGDSLWAIANKFGMTISQLQKLNNIPVNDTLIHPGQILKISGHAVVVTATAAPAQQETTQQPAASQQQPANNNNQAQQLANAVAAQKAAAQQQAQPQQVQQKTVPANVQQQVSAAKSSLDNANAKLSSAESNLARVKAETANINSSSQPATSSSVVAPQTQANYAVQQSQSTASVQQSAQQPATTVQTQQQVKPAAVAQVPAQTQTTQQNNNANAAARSAAVQQAQQQVNQAQQQVNQAQANYNSIVSYAESFVGTPYVWGGTTPAGFDCSGFTQYVYAHEGIHIGRVTTQQENAGAQISVSQAQPGDLLFWGAKGATYHVGIYVGNDKFIAAPEPGQSVSVQSMQYFEPSFAVHVR